MLVRVIDHRNVRMHLHVHDAFKEEEHPRGEGGQFAVGGEGDNFRQLKPEHRKHLNDVGEIAHRYGYKNAPTTENANHAMWTRGDDGEDRHILRAYTKHDWDVDEVKGKPFWYNQKGAGTSGMGVGTKGLEAHLRELHEPKTTDCNCGKTKDMLARVFRIKDTRLFLHFHDFDPEEPREPSGKWTKGGGGGAATKPTKRVSSSAHFQSLEKNAQGKFALPGGKPLPKHLSDLKIPPNWLEARFNPDTKGDLLVVGRDAKGRQQYLYSAKHAEAAAAKKFNRTKALDGPKLDRIIAKNQQAKRSRDARTRDLAGVTSLIMHTGIRPGSEIDTGADYKSYGATTLEGQHVVTDKDGNTSLVFVSGKHKGKDVTIPITDPELAKELQDRAKQAGEGNKIFPHADERRLLSHVKGIAGQDFKTKDFRTLIGTKVAGNEVAQMPVPKSPAEYKKFVKAVATKVSETLGNTPAVAMQSYISPYVFAGWKMASGA
jgi:DNA topoisomerase I